jgi:hypothetical protein
MVVLTSSEYQDMQATATSIRNEWNIFESAHPTILHRKHARSLRERAASLGQQAQRLTTKNVAEIQRQLRRRYELAKHRVDRQKAILNKIIDIDAEIGYIPGGWPAAWETAPKIEVEFSEAYLESLRSAIDATANVNGTGFNYAIGRLTEPTPDCLDYDIEDSLRQAKDELETAKKSQAEIEKAQRKAWREMYEW